MPVPVPLVQLDRSGTRLSPDRAAWAAAREHFAQHHWLRLPQFLAPGLLGLVHRGIALGTFREVRHAAVVLPSTNLELRAGPTTVLLHLVCNDRVLLDALEDLAASGPLASFHGFVYRMSAAHEDHWHSDLVDERRLALSLNVGQEGYEGGVLQIRDARSHAVLAEPDNHVAGSALVFRLDAALEHRVAPVTGGAKTAFAGWFRGAGSFAERLRGAAAEVIPS